MFRRYDYYEYASKLQKEMFKPDYWAFYTIWDKDFRKQYNVCILST